ncbi:MAG: translation initiation factor IF-2 N-terminal domain-containing protein [Pyrinomonadaceae bacterium]|nr:translation initiation factor IF-2 N-terminal domain-containing protein [Pyrinomonadaceae bacterium]
MTVSSKIRLYDLAKELKLDTRRLIEEVRRHGIDVSVPSNSVPKQVANRLREKYLPNQSVTDKGNPKLIHRSFIGPLPGVANSRDISRRVHTEQTQVKATAPTHTEPNQLATKTGSPSFQKRNKPDKRKLMLLYEPPRKSTSKAPHKKQRICTICSIGSPSKALLRQHVVTTHMNEVIAGKAQTRVTATELCRAINADFQELKAMALAMSYKITKESDYIPLGIVKELVLRIQKAGPKQTTENLNESIPTTELLRSTTKLKLELFEKLIKKEFGELREIIDDCLNGRAVGRGNQSLVSDDPAVLFEYARILESKVGGSPPDSFRRRIVRRIFEDIAIYQQRGTTFGAKKLRWKLLPQGKQPFQKLIQHFHGLSQKMTPVVFDIGRLHKVYSLNPDEVFVGTEEFEGYVVFYFALAQTAVLDCPVTGNAIYVFGENWKSLSRLTKSTLLNSRNRGINRIVHNGAWFPRLRSLVATRGYQADLRRQKIKDS